MVVAKLPGGVVEDGFHSAGIDQLIRGWSGAARQPAFALSARTFSETKSAARRWRRSPPKNELVRRKTWPLVGLEHVIGEGVVLRHLR